jgi:MarR family transcriptional repressor of emrRAB
MIKYDVLLAEAGLLQDENICTTKIKTLVELIGFCSKVSEKCTQNLGKSSLSDGQFVVLMLLKHFGSMKPSELAAKAGITRSAITVVLDGLEGKGFVVREHQQQDRRSWIISITDAGLAEFQAILPEQTKWLSQILTILDEEEFKAFSVLVTKICSQNPALDLEI